MTCTRFVLRWGLISALALGGATLLIGPERVAAGLSCVRAKAQSVVDLAVDNPAALRRQLEQLAQEYPDRIAVVQGEIAEVDHQIAQYEHDSEIAGRVVAMTTDDLSDLKTLITRAEEVDGQGRTVAVRFEGVRFNLDQAYGEARRINNVRVTYQDRAACNHQQLDLLNQQKTRLVEILTTLEDEYATFETQMWQLDRQIDAIERNERMIEMTEQLQATLATYEKWGKVSNLKQLEAKLAELRTIQEAQLATLEKKGIRYDYEQRAKYELETESAPADDPFGDPFEGTDTEVKEADSFVFLGPVIVE
jgi:chromosome segregation ATPase